MAMNQNTLKRPAKIKPSREMRVVLDARALFAYGGISVSPSKKAASRPTISMGDVTLKPFVVAAEA